MVVMLVLAALVLAALVRDAIASWPATLRLGVLVLASAALVVVARAPF